MVHGRHRLIGGAHRIPVHCSGDPKKLYGLEALKHFVKLQKMAHLSLKEGLTVPPEHFLQEGNMLSSNCFQYVATSSNDSTRVELLRFHWKTKQKTSNIRILQNVGVHPLFAGKHTLKSIALQ